MIRNLLNIFYLALIALFSLFFVIVFVFYFFGKDLPSFDKLSYYQPRLVSKIFTSNGNFLEDYSTENRVFSSYDEIPEELINCFLVSEDINFFKHIGIDYKGILRAFLKNILKTFTNKRLEGASTITQQVAKNFLLTNEISYTRKIKEIIIALRMEKVLEKKQIMELYLNEIYLGNGSYGVAAASLNYFNKSLASLDLHEMAMLAALPKAPSTYNPYKNPIKALKRRNWVLTRLFDEKYINLDTYTSVLNQKLVLSKSKKILNDNASFFKEEVRREIISKFNESKLYDGGLTIMTTLNEDLQLIAEESFRAGLKSYSFRNGWNGPLMNVSKKKDFFEEVKQPVGIYEDKLGLVVKVNDDHIKIVDKKKNEIKLFKNQMSLIKKKKTNLKKFFKVGDVIVFSFDKQSNSYKLSQIPKVNGGMVVIDNFTGRVLAMVGGYDSSSSFNRVTQAKRQLGSSFKPFVYITALENGYTPISKVLDAPFVIDDLSKDGVWRPTNYGDKFYGLSTLRLGIEKSRNLMTIRLSDQIGLDKVSKISKKLGIYENFPLLISSSLGSLESSLIKITAGYASIANGGYRVEPRMIDVIYDKEGKIIFNGEKRKCLRCNINADDYSSLSQYELPIIKNNSDRIFSKESAYQMTSFLMGVIKRGTAKNINNFSYQIAGKTGTTNENQDAWFIGYNSEITVGVFVGYDEPKSLGKFETGSRVAAPIFRDFMNKSYIKTKPIPFNIPDSIKFINIDLFSGKPSNQNFITESFKYNFNFDDNIDLKVNESDNELKGFY
ncbi:MAG: PBP1A family penicillin-binding protein [Alphaproteobacteria bacterium]